MRYISVMDHFIDIINATKDKGCKLTNSANHRHMLSFLVLAGFITKYSRHKNVWAYQPNLSFKDTVWICINIVGMTRKKLCGGHNIVQRHQISNICTDLFCYTRDKHVNVDHVNNNQIMARNSHSGLF